MLGDRSNQKNKLTKKGFHSTRRKVLESPTLSKYFRGRLTEYWVEKLRGKFESGRITIGYHRFNRLIQKHLDFLLSLVYAPMGKAPKIEDIDDVFSIWKKNEDNGFRVLKLNFEDLFLARPHPGLPMFLDTARDIVPLVEEACICAYDERLEEHRRVTDSEFVDIYLQGLEEMSPSEPTIDWLAERSRCSRSTWSRKLKLTVKNSIFYQQVLRQVEKKINYSKKEETKEKWVNICNSLDLKLEKIADEIWERKRSPYHDNHKYT